MAMNIKNAEVERLAADVARLARESKTEAIRRALMERKARLEMRGSGSASRGRRVRDLLERRIWPSIPADVLGSAITKEEEERILGFGPEGF